MSFLHSIFSLPTGVLLAFSAVVIVLLALWLSALFSRRHFITIRKSEETELISFHLRRIADAVEQLAAVREHHAPLEAPVERPVGMSIFGR
jgi:ABC-type Fe3+ transport system permease subunit